MDRSLDCHEQYSRKNCLLVHGVKENEKEDTDEVITEFFVKEMKRNYQLMTYVDPIDLEKNILEVDLGLLSSNMPGTMSVMSFLEKKKILKGKAVSITIVTRNNLV